MNKYNFINSVVRIHRHEVKATIHLPTGISNLKSGVLSYPFARS